MQLTYLERKLLEDLLKGHSAKYILDVYCLSHKDFIRTLKRILDKVEGNNNGKENCKR